MNNDITNINYDNDNPKYGKLTRKYINPAIAAVTVVLLLGFISGAVYNLPLYLMVGFISFAELISLLLLQKAASRTIITPDLEFNYGYGKYEDLSTISTSLILLISLAYFFYSGISDINNIAYNETLENSNFQNIFLTISIISIFVLGYAKHRLLQSFYNQSHLNIFKKSLYTKTFWESIVLKYLALFSFGSTLSEKLGVNERFMAIVLSLIFVIYQAYKPFKGLRSSLNNLLDKNLPEPILFDFLSVIIENFDKMCEYKSMRTRQSGNDIFVEIDVVLPHDFTISKAYELEQIIKVSLQSKYPNAIPKIYAIPCVPNCIYMQKGTCPIKKKIIDQTEANINE